MASLREAVAEAQDTFLRNAHRLEPWRRKYGYATADAKPITEGDVALWLMNATCVESNRFGSLSPSTGERGSHCRALAYYRLQEIRVNPSFVSTTTQELLLDTVLHEYGHLADWHWNRDCGHGASWQALGFVVGYVPRARTTEQQKKAFRDSMVTYQMASLTGSAHPQLGF